MKIQAFAIVLLLLGGLFTASAQNSYAMFTANAPYAVNEKLNSYTTPSSIIADNDANLNPQDLNYRVLLGVFTHRIPIESDYWLEVRNDLSVTSSNTGYAYSVGFFRNKADAEKKCRELVGKGYLYAKVALYASDYMMQEVAP